MKPLTLGALTLGAGQFWVHMFPCSREHMNPKLTCSQRQWLHSPVGRASHWYREVTGSSPVEVLNFFQASLRNCKNCDHNCEDHSSFEYCDRSKRSQMMVRKQELVVKV